MSKARDTPACISKNGWPQNGLLCWTYQHIKRYGDAKYTWITGAHYLGNYFWQEKLALTQFFASCGQCALRSHLQSTESIVAGLHPTARTSPDCCPQWTSEVTSYVGGCLTAALIDIETIRDSTHCCPRQCSPPPIFLSALWPFPAGMLVRVEVERRKSGWGLGCGEGGYARHPKLSRLHTIIWLPRTFFPPLHPSLPSLLPIDLSMCRLPSSAATFILMNYL